MSPKILIVDDDPDARGIVRFILEAQGYEVLEAGDGQSGVETARSSKPDLVIMDMMMPRKDGFSATLELKMDPHFGTIPIIMLSGIEDHLRGETAVKNIRSGLQADVFMSKPVEPDRLLQTVANLLAARKSERS